MAIEFKTPEEIAQQYLTHLKGLKPEVNTDQTDNDWWIKGHALGGAFSGVYADIRKVSSDAFPQSARREAVEQHLITYFGSGFNDATNAQGDVGVTGTFGSSVPNLTEFLYQPNGNTYQATEDVTLDVALGGGQASGLVPVQSVSAGQAQNLLAGAALTLSSPPPGVNPDAVAVTNLSDGKDAETTEEGKQRVLDRVRNPISGGTKTDYEQWAKEASASVIEAKAIRFVRGPGTMGVVFTAGTTDIDTALNNGDPIIRMPSNELINTVFAYIGAKKPDTDTHLVFAPQSINVNVTARVRYKDGNGTTIPAGQTLTQEELVIREVKRAIYKTPTGGREFGASGFVVCSEIEEVLDLNLSGEPYIEGEFASILVDRQVDDLSATGPNLMILPNQLAEPGTITVVEM